MAPVHEAARRNDVDGLQVLLNADPGLVEADGEWLRRCPLYYACKEGCVEAARLLLDHGAGIEREDHNGWTPLMAACWGGRVEVVSLLLARGADPAIRSGGLCTALMHASFGPARPGSDHVAVLRLLIKDGRVPLDACSISGWTALYRACFHGHAERARVLLMEGGVDHNIASQDGEAPMAAAQRKGHHECVWLLQWYEGELERAWLLSKARAVVEASECISRAAEKAGARTRAEAQAARGEAAPAYLRGRVGRGEALPVLEVVGEEGEGEEEEEEEEEEERGAVCEYLVMGLKDDLFVEVMEGLRRRRRRRRVEERKRAVEGGHGGGVAGRRGSLRQKVER